MCACVREMKGGVCLYDYEPPCPSLPCFPPRTQVGESGLEVVLCLRGHEGFAGGPPVQGVVVPGVVAGRRAVRRRTGESQQGVVVVGVSVERKEREREYAHPSVPPQQKHTPFLALGKLT